MLSPAIQIQNINFSYKGQAFKTIESLSLTVPAGERFGLFGPNGAGKTTLMYLMTGLLQSQNGRIELLGSKVSQNNRAVKKQFGFVPQEYSFYHELSPVENLEFFGAWAGLGRQETGRRIIELLEVLGLADVRNKAVHKFSGGMKRRVNLAIGVIHQPKVLFLDEPTVGVDVQTRHAIIGYLKKLNELGTTLIYTSHQLAEAEDLCQTIALIDQGKIIAHDSLGHLLAQHKEDGLEGLFLNLTGKAYRD